jgi:hypothetical protein
LEELSIVPIFANEKHLGNFTMFKNLPFLSRRIFSGAKTNHQEKN